MSHILPRKPSGWWIAAVVVCASASVGGTSDGRASEGGPDYQREVRPLLAARCFACHGPDAAERQAGLRLDVAESARGELESGARAVVPGDRTASALYERITAADADLRMPPDGDSLTEDEIAVLGRWIDAGAEYAAHWAYVEPVKATLPEVANRVWPRGVIDRFVLARMESEGLSPANEAEAARLVRRVYLDLIGIPPSVDEVDSYLADTGAGAYERLVERLLASPEYGARWARPWLDLARYADSNGFQRDGFRDVWPYRDWVIEALNADMPYDEFSVKQIAGDLLPDATVEDRIATGFHRATTVNVEAGVDQEADRVEAVVDRVNTTGTVWLGTTLECAQCHTHKYDPFSQQEYYQLFAYFNNTPLETTNPSGSTRQFVGPKMELPQSIGVRLKRRQLEVTQARLTKETEAAREAALEEYEAWEAKLQTDEAARGELPKALRTILEQARDARSDANQKRLEEHFVSRDEAYAALAEKLAAVKKELATLAPTTTLVMTERDDPRTTRIMRRGDYRDAGDAVEAGVPTALHAMKSGAAANRLGLAEWLVDDANPLVARVAVNRAWAEFFGRGIVRTPEDFGTQGEPPTHPALLDWLAVDLMANGWSMKRLHRQIVMSATYRQSSRVNVEQLAHDPENAWYARGPRFRLSAEGVRDTALAISGMLSRKRGGPPVRPRQPPKIWVVTGSVDNTYRESTHEDLYRRSIYVMWRRSSPYPSFVNFDATDRAQCRVQRSRTNTALQALTLMNDPVYVEMAVALAEMIAGWDGSDEARLERAFRRAVSRHPTVEELEALHSALEEERKRLTANPEQASKIVAGQGNPSAVEPVELGAWFQVATILLNLDETITKG